LPRERGHYKNCSVGKGPFEKGSVVVVVVARVVKLTSFNRTLPNGESENVISPTVSLISKF